MKKLEIIVSSTAATDIGTIYDWIATSSNNPFIANRFIQRIYSAFYKIGDFPQSGDGLTLEPLRQYFTEKELLDDDGKNLIELVQKRRNAVHAYQDREIGSQEEFQNSMRRYLIFLRYLRGHFPYPERSYYPKED